jgi:hypothetical protein
MRGTRKRMRTQDLPQLNAALSMTAIKRAAFDRFTPSEREWRVEVDLSSDAFDAGSSTKKTSRRTLGHRGIRRPG